MNSIPLSQTLQRAHALLQEGNLDQAEDLLAPLVDGGHPGVLTLMGLIAYDRNEREVAAEWHQRAINADRTIPRHYCNLAVALRELGQFTKALAACEKALKIHPGMPEAVTIQADILQRRDKKDRARRLLRPYLEADTASADMRQLYARILQGSGSHEEVVTFAHEQLDRPDIRGRERRSLLLTLGKSLDRLGSYDEAFAAYAEAKSISALPFEREAWEQSVTASIEYFTGERLDSLPRATNRSEKPVFIAGMPRSGTTLIEQIIHAHPRCFGAGELPALKMVLDRLPNEAGSSEPYPQCVANLTAEQLDGLAKQYLSALEKHDRSAERITDKNLIAFYAIGMIALLFPEARIIHVRRHPLDVCLSCFLSDLVQQHRYTSSLADLGSYYRQYDRLMNHWLDVLGDRILVVEYEALVEHQEEHSRRMIDFLGLPWDDRCLRFYEVKRDVATLSYDQVRQPMYQSAVARYTRYEKHLGPLREALGDLLNNDDQLG